MKPFAQYLYALVFLLVLSPFFSVAQAAGSSGWQDRRVTIDGVTRVYRVYLPARMPVRPAAVLLLHGGTQSMRKIFLSNAGGTLAWLDIADREGVVLIAPNGTNRLTGDPVGDVQAWNDFRNDVRLANVDDVGFLRRVVRDEAERLRLDPARIYVTGASNGGMMTFRLLIEASDLFAGGAAFIANLPEGASQLPRPARAVPLMIVNGTADPLVKWEGGLVARSEARGATLSTAATVAWWTDANRAARAVTRQSALPDLDPRDGCTLTLDEYAATPGGAPVWLYTARGGGHVMPSLQHELRDTRLVRRTIGNISKDAEGAELAWSFFAAHAPGR
jgi:polyhydroxybutyrate depolymerase